MTFGCARLALLASASFIALAGCQSEGKRTVSLDEAKQITTGIQQQRGAAGQQQQRQREDGDAGALFDADVGGAAAEAKLAQMAGGPSADSTLPQQASYYAQRAALSAQAGRAAQAIADAEKAVALSDMPNVGRATRINVRTETMGVHSAVGSMARTVQIAREVTQIAAPDFMGGAYISAHAVIARTVSGMGRFKEAEESLAKARATLRESASWRGPEVAMRRPGWEAGVAWSTAALALRAGRLQEAEQEYRNATDSFARTRFAPPYFTDVMRGWLAMTLVQQGRLAEAEAEARKAVAALQGKVGLHHGQASVAVNALSLSLAEQGRFRDAQSVSQRSVEAMDRAGVAETNTFRAAARLRLAQAKVALGDDAGALATFAAIGAAAGRDAGIGRGFYANPDHAIAQLRTGKAADAWTMISRVVQARTQVLGEQHYDTAEALGVMAAADAALGQTATALDRFAKAIPILLAASLRSGAEGSSLALTEMRRHYILDRYIDVLAAVRGTPDERARNLDAAAEAFRMADAARGGVVAQSLAAGAARWATGADPALADLARREQDAAQRIAQLAGLMGQIATLPSGEQDGGAIEALRRQIADLQGARRALLDEIGRRFPAYAELVNPQPATLGIVQRSLRPGEALVAFHFTRDGGYGWAVPHGGAPVFAKLALTETSVETAVAKLRSALEPVARTLGEIPAFDVDAAHDLYKRLLEPLKAGWGQARTLMIVPQGALGHLPLGLLVTAPARVDAAAQPLFSGYRSVAWLARAHAVAALPSANALPALRRTGSSARGADRRLPFIGFGDPIFASAQAQPAQALLQLEIAEAGPSRGMLRRRAAPKRSGDTAASIADLVRLPDTAEELQSIAGALRADPARDLVLGKDATEGRVKSTDLTRYRVVAFATHGLVPGDVDGLAQPALAMTAPGVAGAAEGGDGFLTMEEILGLKLDADWAVLSACNTASGTDAGAEVASGLGRAFFHAGARALLLTNWSVHSASAKDLTTALFAKQAADPGIGRAEALRQSMLALMDGPGQTDAQGRTAFTYAHPLFWAPFTLVGEGG
ncbi:MAG: CHAT domain-containing protein [Alphaproteobacteria bacterium]|nr:CHAT domain-containing protein [Alphaproteobacteria bacterium]